MINAYGFPPCNESRCCFAVVMYRDQKKCSILTETYEPGKCPFFKKVKLEKANADIRDLVKKKQLTLRDVASKMGVSAPYLSKIMETEMSVNYRIRVQNAIYDLEQERKSKDEGN